MLSNSCRSAEDPAVAQEALPQAMRLDSLVAPEAWRLSRVHVCWSRPLLYFGFEYLLRIILIPNELLPIKGAARSWEERILKLHSLNMRDHRILTPKVPFDTIRACNHIA